MNQTLPHDHRGFEIADKSLDLSDLTTGLDGIRSDTGAILALLQQGAKMAWLRRQKMLNPNAAASGAQTHLLRERDSARNMAATSGASAVPSPRMAAAPVPVAPPSVVAAAARERGSGRCARALQRVARCAGVDSRRDE
ncbi:hypothetical protein [Burkholderia cepacia]|uniref:hypothetical protein n=1 Tax=Burkholderia cepacia TaxID=292 RepID=UPI00158A1910|nr:hypothetical protein [Burkholderia cepacia]